ncbi:MAG: 3'-5' exonuclease [Archangium sp.]|nr:3'-5' exonuclease [Archangium sp.]
MSSIFSRLCFIDIETTGLDPKVDSILEIGLVFVEDEAITRRQSWLIRAPGPVAPLITALTGLSGSEGVADSLSVVEAEVHDALDGWTLVAHNANFERSFLGAIVASNAMIDSWEIAQLLFPELPGHSLDALVRWLEVGRAARHRALDDAEDTFSMLKALVLRVREEDPSRISRIAAHLDDKDRDQRALREFLNGVATTSRLAATPRTPVEPPRAEWTQLVGQSLSAPAVSFFEIEHSALLETAWAAATASTASCAVAVPHRVFRHQSTRRPAIARTAVCTTRLAERLFTLPLGPGRAWLSSWMERTHTGDPDSMGPAPRSRYPNAAELLDSCTAVCACTSDTCPARRARVRSGPALITHELALDWIERGVRERLIILDADRLPDAERHRTQRVLHLDSLERFELDVTELTAALSAMNPGVVLLRSRTSSEWARIRAALDALSAQLRRLEVSHERARVLSDVVEVLEPPGPGFETTVSPDTIARVPVRPHDRVARRLRAGHCLITSFRGGLRWTRRSSWSLPVQNVGTRVEWLAEPASLEKLALVLSGMEPVLLVASEPLAPIADACAAKGLSVSLDEARPSAVQLRKWRRDEPLPSAATCVFYGVRELRRAILASPAKRTVMLSPHGMDQAVVDQALRGLEARPFV